MKNIIFILLFNVIFSIGGNNPWDIFNISSNANDFSLAGSNISEGTEGFYQFTNPALLPKSTNIHYGVSYNMMSLDRSNQVISVNIPLPPGAAVGLSVMRSGTSDIQGTDIFNNKTEIIQNHEMLGMISFGVSFGEYISGGINIKASYSNLDNIFGDNPQDYSLNSKGIGFDGGLLFKSSKFSLGTKIENFKSSKNWNLDLSEQDRSYEEDIPLIYKIGGAFNFSDRLSIYTSKDNSLNDYFLNRAGFKIGYNNLGLRLGFILDDEQSTDFIIPVFGFHYSFKSIQLNYGIDFGSVNQGISHIFTWTLVK